MDIEDWELPAIMSGGQMGAEYLEEINVFDMRDLSMEQWQTFLTIVTHHYHAEHNRLKPCPF